MTTPGRATTPIPAPFTSPAEVSALIDGVDVDAVAVAVRACPAVADLSGGLLGSVGTYLPGRRVPGVVVHTTTEGTVVEVHVVARHGPTMATVAEQVHTVTSAIAPLAQVALVIDDIDLGPADGSPPAA